MKSKKLICMAVAVSLTLGVSATGLTGCLSTNNEEDVKQVVATVDISKNDDFVTEFGDYAAAVSSKTYIKRDMLTLFMNGYYQYVSNGYAYTFNLIKDALVSQALYSQYATAYVLKAKAEETNPTVTLAEYNAKTTETEKYEYLLGGENSEGVRRAKYTLNRSLNTMLDSQEEDRIKEEQIKDDGKDDEYEGSGSRSTPAGIDTLKEDYIPENYNVYTGYSGYLLTEPDMAAAVENGDYEPLDNTSITTRRKAFSDFIGSLEDNYVLTAEDAETTDIWKLSYVQNAYVSQLQQEIIDEFTDLYEKEQEERIQKVEGDVYTYVQADYEETLATQSKEYATSANFESAMGNLSDTSFILYSPATDDTDQIDGTYGTFGYVYNILLPFSTKQNETLGILQDYRDSELSDDSAYFYARNRILKNIKTTDQREAWFNGTTDYSFKAADEGVEDYFGKDEGREYLFFKNNLTQTDKYEKLEKYDGRYSYNGTVTENTNGSYKLVPNKLSIDDMLNEFKAYVNYVLTGNKNGDKVNIYAGDKRDDAWTGTNEAFYENGKFTVEGDDTEIDYSKLVYATGNVTFDTPKADMLLETTDRYKAMAAVNELQYAYTTDTGVLSQYIGYTVSAYTTSYIKEFEYAAQKALREGVGTFKVCAGDYGWHLIYVTETFETAGGAAYGDVQFTKTRVETEGTFENRYYNWLKDSTLANEATLMQREILRQYNTSKAVKVYESAYKDLTEIVG